MMRFQTEMQHFVPDLRSAPIHEHSFSPPISASHHRSNSLEPQTKEQIMGMHKPMGFARNTIGQALR